MSKGRAKLSNFVFYSCAKIPTVKVDISALVCKAMRVFLAPLFFEFLYLHCIGNCNIFHCDFSLTLVVTFQCCTESDNKNFLKNKAAQVFSLIFVRDYPEKVS